MSEYRILVCGGRDYAREWDWGTQRWDWVLPEIRRFYRIMDSAIDIAPANGGPSVYSAEWTSIDPLVKYTHRGSAITIIHGDATGADTLGGNYSKFKRMNEAEYCADWKKYNKGAGFKRNSKMLIDSRPHLVIAFPGEIGTNTMADLAEKANVDVWRIRSNQKQ